MNILLTSGFTWVTKGASLPASALVAAGSAAGWHVRGSEPQDEASRRLDKSLRGRSLNWQPIGRNSGSLARSLALRNPDGVSILDHEGYVPGPSGGTMSNSSGEDLWGHDSFDLKSWEWTWHSPPPELIFPPSAPSLPLFPPLPNFTKVTEARERRQHGHRSPAGCHVCRGVGTSHLVTVLKSEVPAAGTPRPFIHSSAQDARAATRGQLLCLVLGKQMRTEGWRMPTEELGRAYVNCPQKTEKHRQRCRWCASAEDLGAWDYKRWALEQQARPQPDLSARPGSGTTVLTNSQSSPPAEDGGFGDATCERHPWAYTGELAQNQLPFALIEVWTNKETTTINGNFLILLFFWLLWGEGGKGHGVHDSTTAHETYSYW